MLWEGYCEGEYVGNLKGFRFRVGELDERERNGVESWGKNEGFI